MLFPRHKLSSRDPTGGRVVAKTGGVLTQFSPGAYLNRGNMQLESDVRHPLIRPAATFTPRGRRDWSFAAIAPVFIPSLPKNFSKVSEIEPLASSSHDLKMRRFNALAFNLK